MDIILYNIIVGFCSLFFGFIFGSIPTGVIIGKLFYHRDPREEGSKNSGGTNVGRLFGKKIGIVVIILDMLKCAIPFVSVWAIIKYSGLNELFINNFGSPLWDEGIFYIYLAPLGVSLGHCWPMFAKFKGGKTVASFCGFGLTASWGMSIVGITTFFATLFSKKYVSLASIITAIVSTVFAWTLFALKILVPGIDWNLLMWGWGNFMVCGWEFASVTTAISILLIWRHRPNIVRLLNHSENKIKWSKK